MYEYSWNNESLTQVIILSMLILCIFFIPDLKNNQETHNVKSQSNPQNLPCNTVWYSHGLISVIGTILTKRLSHSRYSVYF